MKNIAAYAHSIRALAIFVVLLGLLQGCSVLPKPASPALVYDFGPGIQVAPAVVGGAAPVLLADVDTSPALDSTALVYRLLYSDDQQLRPYAQARWSMPPAQLLRQRLREQLGQNRAVLVAGQGFIPAANALTLRVELEEFSQVFDAVDKSYGLVRLRATLGRAGAQGDALLAQRSFVARLPSTTGDAPGGVRALTQATDSAIAGMALWLQQVNVAAE